MLSTDSRARAPGQTSFSQGKMRLEETRNFNGEEGKRWALKPRNDSKNGFDANDGKQISAHVCVLCETHGAVAGGRQSLPFATETILSAAEKTPIKAPLLCVSFH